MKKLVLAFLVLAIVGAGYFWFQKAVPKSERLYGKFAKFTISLERDRYATDLSYRDTFDRELQDLQDALAAAYLNEKKPDEALVLLDTLIENANSPRYEHGNRVPRNSAQAGLVADYYKMLSDAYGMKNDWKGRGQAMKMSMRYRAEAEQLRKRE